MIDSAEQARPFATPRVAAGALFVDDQGGVLMLRPTYKAYWDIPGGYVEEGETPLNACVREVQEELGLQVAIESLLAVDWAPNPDEGDKVLFVFDGGHLRPEQLAAIQFEDGEISQWAFVDQERLDEVTIPRLARRVRAALSARRSAQTVYLQDGAAPAN
ncbi:NUDIX hydrolase [Actinoplanes sp. NEAU-A12]|uniref:NUDIX hydrolase n=1 Tax=Actinoplanes sandaracinus TaxID=3045177 RepID=A0ABT6WEN2_9ACTN|nr:NUDIX hydrolase [Actinoplanes sandaracinus]MDI6098181.1 NUDIX hydrolase [Actinoplanes sandaracinus]